MCFPGPWTAHAIHTHIFPKDELALKAPEPSERLQGSWQGLQPCSCLQTRDGQFSVAPRSCCNCSLELSLSKAATL